MPWLCAVLAALAAPLVLLALLGARSRGVRPVALGPHAGRLAPCPASPNCVSSQAAGDGHFVKPLRFEGVAGEAWRRLREVLLALPRVRIVAATPLYLRAEFRSPLFGLVDDVEFLLDETAGRIEIRSASRVGYSDLGANRRRVEEIRRRLAAS
ncbi:MAG TPA: DUF1499 domain-containing protein [Candidatus Polarisedimenticolia bacterium]|nr:DUF1499 domain-containing protein [Candidatus Polarisedimenticolia bacterium]